MSPIEREMLEMLDRCEPGRGIMCNTTQFKRTVGKLVSKGWADSLEAAGLFVARITDAGRAELKKGHLHEWR